MWVILLAWVGEALVPGGSTWRAAGSLSSTLRDEGFEVRLEDRDVPEAHRGLHDMLYGSGAAHESAEAIRGGIEDGKTTHDLTRWATECGSRKVTGVYTVRDTQGVVRYVGVSRDVGVALRSHLKRAGPAIASTVRIVEKTSMARRDELEAMRARVLSALDQLPDGNADPSLWADSAADATLDVEYKQHEYGESKRKLMAAMAINDSSPSSSSDSEDLRRATESDDWSALIDAQTAARTTTTTPATIVSPFADTGARSVEVNEGQEEGGESRSSRRRQPFTKQAVDRALDSVRPMLLADGGNVKVVSIEASDKSVVLQLEGACGACPSSTVTMKNGVEIALRRVWPDLGPVTRLEEQTRLLTAEAADRLLEPIRNAVAKLGAKATVLSANLLGPGVVELEYEGPETVRYGIELSLLDSPLVTEVRWYTEPSDDDTTSNNTSL